MKALQVTREYPPHVYGGAGVVVTELTKALRKRIDVEVRAWDEGSPQDGVAIEDGVPVRRYGPWDRVRKGEDGPLFAGSLETLSIALAAARDGTDADVVHAHTWYADMGAMWISMLYDIPLVVTLHSMEPLRPWKRDQLGTGYDVSSWIEKTVVEAADRVVAVSNLMREDILTHYDVDPAKVVVIHNGIDPDVYVPATEKSALEKYGVTEPYVLFVGRISEQKGIFDLIEASRELPDGVQLVVCAAAPDTPELHERLTNATAGRGDILWINEMVSKPDVIQLYTHATVFACPSVYEPFGIINLEAMACGTAVVASATGGILEVVEDGKTGILVPPSNPAELAAALNQVVGDPALAESMGRAGRQRVEDTFSWAAVARQTEALYAELIG
ncbi:MAG: glycogen synthase [Planctomycetota bacterium]